MFDLFPASVSLFHDFSQFFVCFEGSFSFKFSRILVQLNFSST